TFVIAVEIAKGGFPVLICYYIWVPIDSAAEIAYFLVGFGIIILWRVKFPRFVQSLWMVSDNAWCISLINVFGCTLSGNLNNAAACLCVRSVHSSKIGANHNFHTLYTFRVYIIKVPAVHF